MKRLLILCAALLLLPVAGRADQEQPPPLTPEQVAKVRELVRKTQAQTTLLQARLDKRQRDLTELYAQYELDVVAAQHLQDAIIDLQRQLLTSHHTMQVELRSIVNPARFEVLRQRLSRVVGPAAETLAPAERTGEQTTPRR